MAQTTICNLAKASYYVHPQRVGILIEAAFRASAYTPAVLLNVDETNSLDVAGRLSELEKKDDVYCQDFNDTLILQSHAGIDLGPVRKQLLQSKAAGDILLCKTTSKDLFLPEGPYFVQNANIYQAWKLYDDTLGAFAIPVVPDNPMEITSFSVLQAVSKEGSFSSIAVPSRLYSNRTAEKPLSGVRVSIKDNFDLKGVRTTMMNRAYNELYAPRQSSADYVQKLVNLGAVIVGKTKMSAFASAEEPTDQYIDYHSPFNPRGDGYQSPSCSSSGAGASLAGYPWLDHSVGSDTSGSIRLPAVANGLFGLRTTYNLTSKRGIVPSCNEFDTVGTLHRNLDDAHFLSIATLPCKDSSNFPKRLLYPEDFLPQADAEQQSLFDKFASIVERFLGVERTPISIVDTWAKSAPKEAGGKNLRDFLAMSAVWPMYYDTYHTFDDFREGYEARFGKPPFVGPYMRKRWSLALPFTEDDRAKGVEEMAIFREWFSEHVMGPSSETVTDAIALMPFGSACPKYRDDYNKLPSIVGSFSVFYLPAVLQLPQLIIPIGQKAYESRVSASKEFLPIVGSFMGAKDSDLMLINLAKAVLTNAGWPTQVQLGRDMFVREVTEEEQAVPGAAAKSFASN